MLKRLSILSCLLFFSLISFSQKLFIAENGATDIRRSNTDGTSLEVISGFASVNAIRSMVFDEQRNTVFWIESNTLIKKASLIDISGNTRLGFASNYASVTGANFLSLVINPLTRELLASNNGSIHKLNLDATGTITVLPAAFITGQSFIPGFDIDQINGKVYLIRAITSREIRIANLDGSGIVTTIVPNPGVEFMSDISVDVTGGKFYYSNRTNSSVGQIIARDLTTGNNPATIVDNLASTINGIKLDLINGFLFWADGTSAIGRSSLTGSGKIDVVTGLNAPIDVALDFSSILPPKLYWTEPNVNEVQRINTNGSDFERYHFNFASTPNGIAIDQNTRYAYWTDEAQANIIKGFIDETNFSDLDTLIDYPNAANGIGGIALDPSNHMMYFAYTAGGRIQRADYNFTPTPIPAGSIQDLAVIANPFGVALDLRRGKVYYTSNDLLSTNTGTLSRMNLDGTGQEILITQTAPGPQRYMHDVKVDVKNKMVYWVFTEANGAATIYHADVDDVIGTAAPLITTSSGEIRGLEIDFVTDKLWWVSRGIVGLFSPSIMEAQLSDGTGVNTLHTISFTPPRANFIALDRGCDQPIASALFLNAPLGQSSTADPVITSYHHINDVIQVSITQAPTKGVATLQPDGKIFYTPNTGTVGADAIDYQICNQCGLCDQATISVSIPNVPPVIAPTATVQIENGAIAILPLSALLSDLNDNLDISSLTVVTPPVSGASASFNTNNELVVDYTGITFSGVDNLTIEVCDLANECSTSVISITVDAPVPVTPEIVVYNALSPNDDEYNPYLRIENIEVVSPQNKVSIYNRWGDKVFEMDNYQNSDPAKRFNGESDKGKDLPSGVYFYKIEFNSGSPELTGYLTLKR
ncbi:MAG: gliding motility-associated C-terminal domain-containing protein [Cyclobacteriaceae bacterium]|nr:gliding motility-associated C-terminal domain-containing protein [Cyclobacteriaceae bacterium]